MAKSDRRARRRRGKRGGGGSSSRQVVQLNGRRFNPPVEKEWWPNDGDRYYVRIVPNLLQAVDVHGLVNKKNLGDLTVLHPMRRGKPHFNEVPCTYDEHAGPDDFDEYDPSSFWQCLKKGSDLFEEFFSGEDADAVYVLGHKSKLPDAEVYVLEYAHKGGESDFVLEFPLFLARKGLIPEEAEDFEFEFELPEDEKYPLEMTLHDLREAQFLAERCQARLLSCALCAEVEYQYSEGIALSDEERKELDRNEQRDADPRKVQGSKPVFMIGGVFLNWCRPVEDDPKWPGKFQDPNTTNLRAPDDVSMRIGFNWIMMSTSEKSTKRKTWDSLRLLSAKLEETCKNCLVDGARTKHGEHEITVRSVHCPECDGHWHFTDIDEERGTDELFVLDEETCINFETQTLLGLQAQEGQCPHCGAITMPKAVLGCSTCDNPTPVGLEDVIVQFDVVEVRDESGRSNGKFGEASFKKDRKTGKFVYTEKDWREMRMFNDAVTSVDGMDASYSVQDLYEKLLSAEDPRKFYFEKPMFGPKPDPVDQARLIDAEALPLHKKYE